MLVTNVKDLLLMVEYQLLAEMLKMRVVPFKEKGDYSNENKMEVIKVKQNKKK